MQSDGPVTLLHLDPYKVVTGVPSDGQAQLWRACKVRRENHSIIHGCGRVQDGHGGQLSGRQRVAPPGLSEVFRPFTFGWRGGF